MTLKDFIFSYKSCLIGLFKKKNYFSCIKRIFLLPFKYIVSILRDVFINKDIDKITFQENNKSLDEYLKYFKCDKSSLVHGYDKFYLNELNEFKNSNINIIEFGIHYGSSQAAFSKYFSKSNIIGIDKNPYNKKFSSKRIRSLYCDVSDRNSLKLLKNYLKTEPEIIIDDASHIPDDQLKTFIEMFDKLKNRGLYIVEELDIFESFSESYNPNLKIKNSELRTLLHSVQSSNNSNIEKISKNIEILNLLKKIDWVKIFRGNYIINNKNVSEIAFIKKI